MFLLKIKEKTAGASKALEYRQLSLFYYHSYFAVLLITMILGIPEKEDIGMGRLSRISSMFIGLTMFMKKIWYISLDNLRGRF